MYSRDFMADRRVGAQITRLCRAVELAQMATRSGSRRDCEDVAAWGHEVVPVTGLTSRDRRLAQFATGQLVFSSQFKPCPEAWVITVGSVVGELDAEIAA